MTSKKIILTSIIALTLLGTLGIGTSAFAQGAPTGTPGGNVQAQIDALVAHTTLLQSQVDSLQSQIDANDADNLLLQSQIDANDGDIIALQSQIDDNDADNINLQNQVTGLQSQIDSNDSDISSLQAADLDLQGLIDALTIALNNGLATLQAALNIEVADRTTADDALTIALDDETNARIAGDDTLQSVIDSEILSRADGDAQTANDAQTSNDALELTLQSQIDLLTVEDKPIPFETHYTSPWVTISVLPGEYGDITSFCNAGDLVLSGGGGVDFPGHMNSFGPIFGVSQAGEIIHGWWMEAYNPGTATIDVSAFALCTNNPIPVQTDCPLTQECTKK